MVVSADWIIYELYVGIFQKNCNIYRIVLKEAIVVSKIECYKMYLITSNQYQITPY